MHAKNRQSAIGNLQQRTAIHVIVHVPWPTAHALAYIQKPDRNTGRLLTESGFTRILSEAFERVFLNRGAGRALFG